MKIRTHASAEPLSSSCAGPIEPDGPVLPVEATMSQPMVFITSLAFVASSSLIFQAVERVVDPSHLALADLAVHELINTH